MTDQIAPPPTVFVVPDTASDLTPEGRAVIVRFQVAVQGEEWQQHHSELCAAITDVDQFSCGGTYPYWDYPENQSESDILVAISGGLRLYVTWRREIGGPKADRATLLKEFRAAEQRLFAELQAQLTIFKSGQANE